MNLFPHLYVTLKNHNYFVVGKAGFLDESGRFKVFRFNESLSDATPRIEVELRPGPKGIHTDWMTPEVIFHVWGTDRDWNDLYEIAGILEGIFKGRRCFDAVEGGDPLPYEIVGDSDYGEDRNMVSEQVVVSVALGFGLSA